MPPTFTVNVTLDEAAAAFIDRVICAQPAAAAAVPPPTGVPNALPSERYAGVAFVDGRPSHHLFLLAAKPKSRLQWQDAKDWAESVGGELPERFEAALLYANLRDQFDTDNWHWTATQYSAGSAWVQGFVSGTQYYYDKDYEFLARAVRRLPL